MRTTAIVIDKSKLRFQSRVMTPPHSPKCKRRRLRFPSVSKNLQAHPRSESVPDLSQYPRYLQKERVHRTSKLPIG
ncbi:hypothetical protein EI94DRAFT_1732973, partial [Lactarius quietus]